MPESLKVGRQFRSIAVERAGVNEEARTVDLSFSSEAPVDRWFGREVLDHDPASIRLDRLKDGGPVLLDHNTRQQVGVVETVAIAARKGRAVLRFGRSDQAGEVFQDIVDGIRRNVSVGYQVYEMRLESSSEDKGDAYRVTDWEPLEISIVAVPADTTVGVGREVDAPVAVRVISTRQEEQDMPEATKKKEETQPAAQIGAAQAGAAHTRAAEPDATQARAAAEAAETRGAEVERKRIADILQIGRDHGFQDLADAAVREGQTVEGFRAAVLNARLQKEDTVSLGRPAGHLDMDRRDQERYSLVRAMRAQMNNDWSRAGFELECSREIANRLDKDPGGFFVPSDLPAAPAGLTQSELRALQLERVLTTGGAAAGQELVGTDHLGGSFIELLRSRMMVRALGARMLDGLMGNVDIPKQTAGSVATWVGEDTESAESELDTGQITLSPNTLSVWQRYSKKLLIQSDPSIEGLVRSDLATALALGFDAAAINGSGSGAEPTGILNTVGIGDVSHGSDGGAPTWGTMVEFETDVAVGDADIGALAYLTTPQVRGKLKTTEKASSTGLFIWDGMRDSNGMGSLNGYPAAVSTQVPSNLTKGGGTNLNAAIFGNWNDLILAEWGVLDVQVNPFTEDTFRRVRVVACMEADIAVRRVASFSKSSDIDAS